MSSILTALKKLEEDSPSAPDLRSLKDQKRLKGIIRSRQENSKRKKKAIIVVSLSIILILTAIIGTRYYIGLPSFPESEKLISSPQNPTKATPLEKAAIQNSGVAPTPPANSIPAPPTPVATNPPMPSPRTPKTDTPFLPGETIAAKSAPATLIPVEGFDRPLARTPKVVEQNAVPAEKEPPEATASPEEGNEAVQEIDPANAAPEPPLNAETVRQFSSGAAPDLKLQAIAYADDPKKRMAVIDGRIVHEKDMIGEYKLTRINRENIEITKDGVNWRIEFEAKR